MSKPKQITQNRWSGGSSALDLNARRPVGRGEDGFTLIELLVAMVLMIVVAAGPLAWIIVSSDQQNQISSTTFATRTAEVGMEALTRDLHEAYETPFGTPTADVSSVVIATSGTTTTLTLDLPPTTALPYGQPVTWSCVPLTGCLRTQGTSKRTLFAGLDSMTLTGTIPTGSLGATTTANTDPDYIAITAKVYPISQLDTGGTHTVTSGTPITVSGGADLRGLQ